MDENLTLWVSWAPSTKRWVIACTAETTEGCIRLYARAEDPYGCPLSSSTAEEIVQAVRALMSQQSPDW